MKQAQLPQIIQEAGGPLTISRALGISRVAIYQWKRGVPKKRVPFFCIAFGYTPNDVRPDLYDATVTVEKLLIRQKLHEDPYIPVRLSELEKLRSNKK